MSNRYELECLVKNELCYDHNKNSRSPYYGEWVDKSKKGAVDIELERATKKSFTFKLYFIGVSESFALDWCEKYFASFNMRMRDSADTEECEKGWFYVKASVPTEDICKHYGMDFE